MDINKIRTLENLSIIVLGNHAGIIQSMLDFDFLAGKTKPSIVAIVGGQRDKIRYFWGKNEIFVRNYKSVDVLAKNNALLEGIDMFVAADSGRRTFDGVAWMLSNAPKIIGGMVFAESVPERHAIRMKKMAAEKGKFVLGPASVGFIVPGVMKLGAIAGTQPEQIVNSGSLTKGSTAIISTSGGMINEIISYATSHGSRLSFAAAVGGERYPMTTPATLVQAALDDADTKTILFFGELGGRDEYEVADLVSASKTQKTVIAYIAGSAAEAFETAPQFGHAKALAQNESETASAKRKYMAEKGITVAHSFAEFEGLVAGIAEGDMGDALVENEMEVKMHLQSIVTREKKLFTSRISGDSDGSIQILGEPLLDYVSNKSLSEIALGMFLGHTPKSQELKDFVDLTFRLLVDHGPQVSGAVNTMITARAGKDLPSALASGLLTIGPRFGGAIDGAAKAWLKAVETDVSPRNFVEMYAKNKEYIPGIGHKKYRVDNPDPRVSLLLEQFDNAGKATQFAKDVATITTNKKAQLILNVDGVVAALLIDILLEKENYSHDQVSELIKTEFCNALFVYARTVGFIALYLDQRRADEDLFRLPENLIGTS